MYDTKGIPKCYHDCMKAVSGAVGKVGGGRIWPSRVHESYLSVRTSGVISTLEVFWFYWLVYWGVIVCTKIYFCCDVL